MKRELKSYLAGWLALYLAAVCLPFLLAGCASDGAAPWPVDGETTSVTLRMSVAGAVGTRADGTEDEYATLENRINTLRVLVVTDGNKIAVNHKLTPEELAAQTVTIENVPVGKVTFCVLANEAALGKDYDTEEFELVDVPDRTSKEALLEDPDRTYFPKRFSEVNIDKGLPMSWIVCDYEVKAGSPTLRTKGTTELAKRMDIAEEKVPLVYISAILTRRIAELMGAELVWAPGVTLCDGIAYEYAEQNKMFRGEHDFAEDIIACALNISKRYNGSSKRADTLEHITTTIFDSMKKVHGMGQRERLYLRLAAILHDCGKYISLLNVGEASYDIIMATEMIGLSHMEREIVANVVRFNHSDFVYYGQAQERPMGLDKASYLTVAKLTAILRLANSLDRSHKQKMKGVKAVLQENELILKVDTQEDITLEKGFFQTSTEFFKEVYSITPVIRQKKKF